MSRYSDTDLAAAVARAHSWRGVLRRLGLPPQSSSALRSARCRADGLGIDHSHFTGQRRWSDRALRDAVQCSYNWAEVVDRLGLSINGGSSQALVRSHAARLRLDVSHLAATTGAPIPEAQPFSAPARLELLDRAGPLLAASWFTMRGYEVAWPLEPCRYDLLVTDEVRSVRVQVKTTTRRSAGSWVVRIAPTRRRGTAAYGPEEIDYFFVIDGDLGYYVIPLAVVGGLQVISLRRYSGFAVDNDGPASSHGRDPKA